MNGKIAPKSNVIGVADLIALWGRQNPSARHGECTGGASGVRTAGMQSKGFTGTRESRQVQA